MHDSSQKTGQTKIIINVIITCEIQLFLFLFVKILMSVYGINNNIVYDSVILIILWKFFVEL